MRPAKLLGLAAAILLTACTPPTHYPTATQRGDQVLIPQPPVQRARQNFLKDNAGQPITCTMGSDCNEKWARALQWVSLHSQYSIKTSTDSEILTYGPIEPTTDAAFDVTRTPADASTMTISFKADCGKSACVPTVLELTTEFKNYILTGSMQNSGDY